MQNFIQQGDTVDITAPSTLVSGQGLLLSKLFGVSCDNYASGAPAELLVKGVVELPIDASTPSVGDLAYWDNTGKQLTTTSTANSKIGHFVSTASGGVARVRLVQGLF